MPLGSGVRYRYTGTGANRRRLAFRGNTVVENVKKPAKKKKRKK